MVIQDEGVVQEKLEQVLIAPCQIEGTLWGHNVPGAIWEREGVVNRLAF
jgi:hypothetical protein